MSRLPNICETMFIFRLVRLTGIAWKGRYEKPCGREAFAPSDRCCHTSDFPYTGCFASYTLTNANFAVLLSFVRLGGLKKIQGASKRIFPATTAMLEWVEGRLHIWTVADGAVLWAARSAAFLFSSAGRSSQRSFWTAARPL